MRQAAAPIRRERAALLIDRRAAAGSASDPEAGIGAPIAKKIVIAATLAGEGDAAVIGARVRRAVVGDLG